MAQRKLIRAVERTGSAPLAPGTGSTPLATALSYVPYISFKKPFNIGLAANDLYIYTYIKRKNSHILHIYVKFIRAVSLDCKYSQLILNKYWERLTENIAAGKL